MNNSIPRYVPKWTIYLTMEHTFNTDTKPYKTFALMLGCSLVVMYAVMFLNVSSLDHIYLSLTRCYMALLMVSPMALLMLLLMGRMYTDRRLNRIIAAGSVLVFALAFGLLRSQTPIGDVQYMRAMIPHHSSAILTSTHADIMDPEVRKLADGIIDSQRKEIAEMKVLLTKLDK